MRQQINLANPALLPPKPFFQLHRMVLSLAAIAIVLLAALLLIQLPLQSYEQTAETAHQRVLSKQEQLKAMEQQIGLRQKNPRYASEVARIQQEEQRLQEIAATMQTDEKPIAYSAYLQALSQTSATGVWLREINFDGPQVSLEGLSLRAQVLPDYLNELNRQPAFKGLRFSSFEIGRQTAANASATSALVFRLESAPTGSRP